MILDAEFGQKEHVMTFLEWCKRQCRQGDYNSVWDFCDDYIADRKRPRAPSRKRLLAYLVSCEACDGALEAAKKAYALWLRTSAKKQQRAPKHPIAT